MDYRVVRPADGEDIDIVDVVRPLERAMENLDSEQWREFLAAATPGQRMLYAYNLYFYEVENGGHEQFFCNPSGMLWREVLEAVQQFGLKKDEQIFRDALAAFADSAVADDESARQAQVEAADSSLWNDLDRRFYGEPSHGSGGGTAEAIQEYIRRHPDEFFLP